MGRPQKLNIAQKKEIINLYFNKNLSTFEISKIYTVNAETIANVIKSMGFSLRKRGETKKLSTNFSFREMSKEKAFILGLIFGDGSISIRNDYVNITSKDLDLLERVQLVIGFKFKIKKVKNKNYYYGVIYSKKICEELFSLFNLKNNKSDKLIYPLLDKALNMSFISGFLASDGCISVSKSDKLLHLSFYSCSRPFLEKINEIICNRLNLPERKIYERVQIKDHFGKKPLFILMFNGVKAIQACEVIFSETEIRSNRKYQIYIDYIRSTDGGGR